MITYQVHTFAGVRYPNFSVAFFLPNLGAFCYVIICTFFIFVGHVSVICITLPLGQLLAFLSVFLFANLFFIGFTNALKFVFANVPKKIILK